jgi:hypothetical protein
VVEDMRPVGWRDEILEHERPPVPLGVSRIARRSDEFK